MMIPTLACSIELMTVDSQPHPPRCGALLTDPETFETLAGAALETVDSIAIFAAAAPRARSSEP